MEAGIYTTRQGFGYSTKGTYIPYVNHAAKSEAEIPIK